MSWSRGSPEDDSGGSRGFGRWFSDLASAGREVKRVARETRDAMVLLRHTAKHGEQTMDVPAGFGAAGGDAVRVEIISAADLSLGSKSLPVPYCSLAVGYAGQPWAAKFSSANRECNTPPALRQRHPRWSARCQLGLPQAYVSPSRVDFSKEEPSEPLPELSVRVMDAGGLRGDRVAGEARVPLSASGCGTFRLLGGGYASLSLRWAVGGRPAALRRPDFERAVGFWSQQDLSSPTGLTHAQLELAAVLATCRSPEEQRELNELILQAPLSALFSDLTDRRDLDEVEAQSIGSQSLMTVLSEHLALHRFTPLASSRLVGALVEKITNFRTSSDETLSQSVAALALADGCEDLLCKLFLRASGEDLLELKKLVDAAGGGRDLRETVFTVVAQQGRRSALLQHFGEEALALQVFPKHILADIDMTVWVGTFGAGGPKFPTGPVPGALPLFHALGGRVTFLSARPPIWEGQTRRLLVDDIGIAEAVVLPGSLKAIAQVLYAPEQAKQAMAERKTEVFGQFAALHPDASFIFIGDSGEGDVDFAEDFMRGHEGSPSPARGPARAALIHDVVRRCAQGTDGVVPKSNAARRAELRMRGIHVFDTYAGAALELFRRNLLSGEGLRQATHGA
ncbi:unnamed protein product [Effrenium voratum]|nr:unnamed protein product [Effrenium voratum]